MGGAYYRMPATYHTTCGESGRNLLFTNTRRFSNGDRGISIATSIFGDRAIGVQAADDGLGSLPANAQNWKYNGVIHPTYAMQMVPSH